MFPGQGAQFSGMGKDLYNSSQTIQELFEKANQILGFNISNIMFTGSDEELRQTKVTQPAIFIHSVALARSLGSDFKPDMVAGHSLGEFSALVSAGAMTFEDGLLLVSKRAQAMQLACEENPSTMAAILGLEDSKVEEICESIDDVVVPANYNCPGQIVISGSLKGVEEACTKLKENGAKRALTLKVGGAFHSPFMNSAKEELEKAIFNTQFQTRVCPVDQNVATIAETSPERIKENLVAQLTAPVKWTQSVINMIQDGATEFIELGPGNVLQGLVSKINKDVTVSGIQ